MDHYTITIKATVPVLAENHQDAEMVAVQAMKDAQDSLPAEIDFNYSAYLTPNQDERLKQRAINFS